MNIMIAGAMERRSIAPQKLAGHFTRKADRSVMPGTLSTFELRQLVAQMVD
ncbi:MAG: hypothetical protein KDE15_15345 [Erythrobacter sp.]|nr:hypothetical protein [Erythrobacter sp.]